MDEVVSNTNDIRDLYEACGEFSICLIGGGWQTISPKFLTALLLNHSTFPSYLQIHTLHHFVGH